MTTTIPNSSSKPTVLELVKAAGVDVSDWESSPRGASNPKYCYQWSFVEPGTVVVLNLWRANMVEIDGEVTHRTNLLADANFYQNVPGKSAWVSRARKADHAIATAQQYGLPIRVIVLDGVMRRKFDLNAEASTVTGRILDPEIWSVANRNDQTGETTLTRGRRTGRFVDQFTIALQNDPPTMREASVWVRNRNPDVRNEALRTAEGRCQYCGVEGFKTAAGSIYLETHHIVPLSDDGPDHITNVIALCPNHHREAHYGTNPEGFRKALIAKLRARL